MPDQIHDNDDNQINYPGDPSGTDDLYLPEDLLDGAPTIEEQPVEVIHHPPTTYITEEIQPVDEESQREQYWHELTDDKKEEIRKKLQDKVQGKVEERFRQGRDQVRDTRTGAPGGGAEPPGGVPGPEAGGAGQTPRAAMSEARRQGIQQTGKQAAVQTGEKSTVEAGEQVATHVGEKIILKETAEEGAKVAAKTGAKIAAETGVKVGAAAVASETISDTAMVVGATAGSVVPVVGTGFGAVVGKIVGWVISWIAVDVAFKALEAAWKRKKRIVAGMLAWLFLSLLPIILLILVIIFFLLFIVRQYNMNPSGGGRKSEALELVQDVRKTTETGQLGVSKRVAPNNPENPTELTYKIEIFNRNVNPVEDLALVDNKYPDKCVLTATTLAVNSITSCTFTVPYNAETDGFVINQVTVTATDPIEKVTLTASAAASFGGANTGDVPCGWPVTSRRVTWGCNSEQIPARATDIGSVGNGSPVTSQMSGTGQACIMANNGGLSGYGNFVIVDNGSYRTRYAHLLRKVAPGAENFPTLSSSQSGYTKCGATFPVTKDQTIGYTDNTGHSTGSHLHYEIYKGGVLVCPHPEGPDSESRYFYDGAKSFLDGSVDECVGGT